MKKIAVIMIGASGSGKSSLEKALANMDKGFHKVVSHTTRAIRLEDGEENGVTYHYVSQEEFKNISMIEEVNFGGNFYGVAQREFETDKDVLVVVEPHGAKQILEYIKGDFHPIVIFMDIPKETRIENMINRGDSEEKIQKRLEIDDIEERFKSSGIIADKTVKRLTPSLHLDVYEFIQITKKNIS